MTERSARPERRALVLAAVAVGLVLAATADERTLGSLADEQQIHYAAVSIAEHGELGIGVGQIVTAGRAGGDSFSLYGMGLTLLEVPVALAANAWETRFGPRSSQTLLVCLQLALVLGAAAVSGLVARALGATPSWQVAAVVATGLGSPLGAYAATGLTEPLQALCLTGALLLSARSVREPSRRGLWLAAAAGFVAGYAVLAKSVNVMALPGLLAPIALDAPASFDRQRRLRLAGTTIAGSLAPMSAWLAFELVRFGRPFGSHAHHGFGTPLHEGVWRLLVGPNEGLFLYAPVALLGLLGLATLATRPETRGSALGIAGVFLPFLALYASYWAWDGWSGWGPRYLVPAIPLLVAAAAAAFGGGAPPPAPPGARGVGSSVAAAAAALARGAALRRVTIGAIALGLPINLLGLLQSDATAAHYVASTGTVPLTAEQARGVPPEFVSRGASGEPRVSRLYTSASDASFSPFLVHAFLLRARLRSLEPFERKRLLAESPPWREAHPEAVPDLGAPGQTVYGVLNRNLTEPFSWPFLGRAVTLDPSDRAATFVGLWNMGLADQVGRKLDLGEPAAAARIAEKLHDVAPSGYAAALFAESLRLSGRHDELGTFLASLPPDRRRSPLVQLVHILALRDAGRSDAAEEIALALTGALPPAVLRDATRGPAAHGLRTLMREMTTSGQTSR